MRKRGHRISAFVTLGIAASVAAGADAPSRMPPFLLSSNPSGVAATLSTTGAIDTSNPFFVALGTNGRACVTCHRPDEGWTVTPAGLRARFDATQGTDPIFRTNDGSTSPHADVSTVAARLDAYGMLLRKGLIRVGMPIPGGAEFELAAVDDPYGYASASELSLFRRPLPATNLRFLSAVMWDGRETFLDPSSATCIMATTRCFASIHFDLADQANGATTGHAQASTPLTDAQREQIVGFESALVTAQFTDRGAGPLAANGATGGPRALAAQPFYFGINDAVSGDYRTGAPFTPRAFSLFESWRTFDGAGLDERGGDSTVDARLAIARGEQIFNTRPIRITGVKGLNDDLHMPVLEGTCTTCHDAPNAGDHSIPIPLDIGIADGERRTPDLPLYTLRNKATGEIVQTTDPGRALVTGKWNDIGKFKGPVLRALATRAPYFHNGSAADLDAVVDFYDQRFGLQLSDREHDDLVAFLGAL